MFARCTVVGSFILGALALSLAATAGDPKPDDRNAARQGEEQRKGVVTGVVTAKGESWIEVKGDGEERARRYVPHWRGGAPAAGGGLDKEMVARIKEVPVHSRVMLNWVFEERPRVEKIEVLRTSAGRGKDAAKDKQRSGTIAGEIKAKKAQGKNVVIEVLAPGEEKARSYFVQFDPKINAPIPEVLKAVRAASVGDRVLFDWEATNHGPAIVKFEVQKKTEEKPCLGSPPEIPPHAPRPGSVRPCHGQRLGFGRAKAPRRQVRLVRQLRRRQGGGEAHRQADDAGLPLPALN
jgi:hypothetical protein